MVSLACGAPEERQAPHLFRFHMDVLYAGVRYVLRSGNSDGCGVYGVCGLYKGAAHIHVPDGPVVQYGPDPVQAKTKNKAKKNQKKKKQIK